MEAKGYITNQAISTELVFGNPVATDDLGFISRAYFKTRKRIEISTIHPRQTELESEVLNMKITGKNHSIPYVVITPTKNIIIDGHHTVASKKINGRRYVIAMTVDHEQWKTQLGL